MRLSLRTLLAFEDNVFDVEQHRRLEQLLPADKSAEATLRRIRSIVRNPSLGVPGLVDHQEELDPNYVAEYLDHQMSGSVQEKFETYCLSADKYLAEVASVHHILSNVLGEPARTSRECRLKCYDVLHSNLYSEAALPAFSAPEPQTHFKPYEAPVVPQVDKPVGNGSAGNGFFASLWQRLFPIGTAPETAATTSSAVPAVTPAAAPAQTQTQTPAAQEEKRPSLWTFAILGLIVCALLLGWQHTERQRLAQQPCDADADTEMVAKEPETVFPPFAERRDVAAHPVAEHHFFDNAHFRTHHAGQQSHIADTAPLEPFTPLEPLTPLEPIAQVVYTTEVFTPFTVAPADDATEYATEERLGTLAASPWEPSLEPAGLEPLRSPLRLEEIASDDILNNDGFVHATTTGNATIANTVTDNTFTSNALTNNALTANTTTGNAGNLGSVGNTGNIVSEELPMMAETEETTIVAFQPIVSPARVTASPARSSEFATSSNIQHSPAPSSWQPLERLERSPEATAATVATVSTTASAVPPPPAAVAAIQPLVQQQSLSNPSQIAQMSATVATPRVVGRAMQTSPASLIFSAMSADASWQLLPLPFDLNGDQYLLTAAPFRGTFELGGNFRVEMIGDAKLCILPPDASGIPGIFVDYGRIIIYPLQANQSLRIETERARGIVSSTGTESVLFIDTFAEVTEPLGSIRPPEEQRPRTTPILGFVPLNGERIIWQSVNQLQPFFADAQGSVLLQSDRYRFGEVRNLPNWLGVMPVSSEDRMLAEVCRRYFAEAHGNGEQALTRLIQDESPAVRTLGLRLWGDLGRFDVPIAAAAERRQGEEAIRHVLNQYFEEVMRRDDETVQRFADAIQSVREAQRD